MLTWATRVVAAAVLAAGCAVGATAAGAAGPGTFTTITTPSGNLVYHFNGASGATNTLTVSGKTSADVTSVDIDCIFTNGAPFVRTYATAVPVTSGAFSTIAVIAMPSASCRLRAIPTGVDAGTAYLGSFAGPILSMYTVVIAKDGTTPVGYVAIGEESDGVAQAADAGECGIALIATEEVPGLVVHGTPNGVGCGFGLPSANVSNTGSAITVDGHNAYLPSVVKQFLRGTLVLSLTQPALTVTSTHASNGDLTVTETAPLMRCSHDDSYPPTATSCPSLVSTGVRFHRVMNLFRGDHQVRIRDSFTANGIAHVVRPQYQVFVVAAPFGGVGFRFPGHSAFTAGVIGQVLTGFASTAATVFAKNDRYAVEGDPVADTLGFSWSRGPALVRFDHASTDRFGLSYVLSVPANKSTYVGFAETEHLTTSATVTLAAVATGEVVNVPTITSPAAGATVSGTSTTVKGTVTLGANGLPTSVLVNGHAATLTSVSATTKSFKVTFSEAVGSHKITVVAKDSAGNTRSRSITIKNV